MVYAKCLVEGLHAYQEMAGLSYLSRFDALCVFCDLCVMLSHGD